MDKKNKEISKYFGKIYLQYVEKIYRFVFLKVDSIETAQDLTSEVFFKVFRIISSSNSSSSIETVNKKRYFRFGFIKAKTNNSNSNSNTNSNSEFTIKNIQAFLYKTARNLVIDYYRKRHQTVSLDNQESHLEIVDPAKDPLSRVDLSFELQKIKEALKKVKKPHQEAIILHYIEDLPIKEVAQIMDRSEGAIRVMLHRGLKDLKNKLEN